MEKDSRFEHLLKPIRDLAQNWSIDVAKDLEDYLDELDHIQISFDGGKTSLNFAEAALLIQGSACVYSRKVEYLYSLIYQALDVITNQQKGKKRMQDAQKAADADIAAMEEEADEEFLLLDDVIQVGRNLYLKERPEDLWGALDMALHYDGGAWTGAGAGEEGLQEQANPFSVYGGMLKGSSSGGEARKAAAAALVRATPLMVLSQSSMLERRDTAEGAFRISSYGFSKDGALMLDSGMGSSSLLGRSSSSSSFPETAAGPVAAGSHPSLLGLHPRPLRQRHSIEQGMLNLSVFNTTTATAGREGEGRSITDRSATTTTASSIIASSQGTEVYPAAAAVAGDTVLDASSSSSAAAGPALDAFYDDYGGGYGEDGGEDWRGPVEEQQQAELAVEGSSSAEVDGLSSERETATGALGTDAAAADAVGESRSKRLSKKEAERKRREQEAAAAAMEDSTAEGEEEEEEEEAPGPWQQLDPFADTGPASHKPYKKGRTFLLLKDPAAVSHLGASAAAANAAKEAAEKAAAAEEAAQTSSGASAARLKALQQRARAMEAKAKLSMGRLPLSHYLGLAAAASGVKAGAYSASPAAAALFGGSGAAAVKSDFAGSAASLLALAAANMQLGGQAEGAVSQAEKLPPSSMAAAVAASTSGLSLVGRLLAGFRQELPVPRSSAEVLLSSAPLFPELEGAYRKKKAALASARLHNLRSAAHSSSALAATGAAYSFSLSGSGGAVDTAALLWDMEEQEREDRDRERQQLQQLAQAVEGAEATKRKGGKARKEEQQGEQAAAGMMMSWEEQQAELAGGSLSARKAAARVSLGGQSAGSEESGITFLAEAAASLHPVKGAVEEEEGGRGLSSSSSLSAGPALDAFYDDYGGGYGEDGGEDWRGPVEEQQQARSLYLQQGQHQQQEEEEMQWLEDREQQEQEMARLQQRGAVRAAAGGSLHLHSVFSFQQGQEGGAAGGSEEHAASAAAGGPGYASMVEMHMQRIEAFIRDAGVYAQESAIQKRVGDWQERMAPLLQAEDRRRDFDIQAYGTMILGSMQAQPEEGELQAVEASAVEAEAAADSAMTRLSPEEEEEEEEADPSGDSRGFSALFSAHLLPFSSVLAHSAALQEEAVAPSTPLHPLSTKDAVMMQVDVPRYEVCRHFLATLQLANNGNVEIVSYSAGLAASAASSSAAATLSPHMEEEGSRRAGSKASRREKGSSSSSSSSALAASALQGESSGAGFFLRLLSTVPRYNMEEYPGDVRGEQEGEEESSQRAAGASGRKAGAGKGGKKKAAGGKGKKAAAAAGVDPIKAASKAGTKSSRVSGKKGSRAAAWDEDSSENSEAAADSTGSLSDASEAEVEEQEVEEMLLQEEAQHSASAAEGKGKEKGSSKTAAAAAAGAGSPVKKRSKPRSASSPGLVRTGSNASALSASAHDAAENAIPAGLSGFAAKLQGAASFSSTASFSQASAEGSLVAGVGAGVGVGSATSSGRRPLSMRSK